LKKKEKNMEYNNGGLNIFNEDALEFLLRVGDNSIDLIYCDLPFGVTQCGWDEVIPFDRMWEQVIRVAKKNAAIVFHAQQPFTSALIMSNIKMFKYVWVWEKSKATGFLNAKRRPLVAHEDIVIFCKGTPVYYPQMTEGIAYDKGVRKKQSENDIYGSFDQVQVKSGGKRYPRSVQYFKTAESEGKTWHKTQKPKALCEYIIKTYSKVGDVVLDFAAGSGTAGVGVDIGRTVILVEKDINEFENLKNRWGVI